MELTKREIYRTVQGAVEVLLGAIYGEETEVDWQDPEIQSALEDAVLDINPDGFKNSHNLHDALVSGTLLDTAEGVRDAVIRHLSSSRRRRNPPKITGDPTLFDGQETKQEKLYRELVNLFIERELVNRPEVLAFRRKLNGGILLSETDAGNVLANELAGIVTFEDCEEQGLSAACLTGRIVNWSSITDGGTQYVARFGYPGWSREKFQFDLIVINTAGADVSFTVTHSTDTYKHLAQRKHAGLTYVHSENNLTPAAVIPPHEADSKIFKTWRTVSGYGASIIGMALDIAADISAQFQWDTTDTLFWLLAGNLPNRGSVYGIRWPLIAVRTIRVVDKQGITLGSSNSTSYSSGPVEIITQPWIHSKNLEAFFRRVLFPGRKALPPLSSLDLFRRIQAETPIEQEPAWEAFTKTPSFAEWRQTYQSTTQSRGAVRTTYKRVESYLQAFLLWLVSPHKHSSL